MNATITNFKSFERNGDSEAMVKVDDKCVGFITGSRNNVGSLLCPRFVITSYDVCVDIGDVEHKASFATKREAVAFAKSLFA